MTFSRCFVGFFALAVISFAAEPPTSGLKTNVVTQPSAGGLKTNVVEGPSSTTGLLSDPTLPAASVFDGAPFKVYQGTMDVTSLVLVTVPDPKKSVLKFQPGQIYSMVRDNISAEPENAAKGRRGFPVVFGGLGRNRNGATVAFKAELYFTFGKLPLAWNSGAKSYESALSVFYVVDPEGVTPPINFAAKVRFDAVNGSVQPQEVTMTPTEQSQRVMIRTTSIDRPVVVSLKIDGHEIKSAAMAAGELGSLRLTAKEAEISGFGAGQTGLHVERFDPLDRPLLNDEPLNVSFSVDGPAALTPPATKIPVGASGADVQLKSTGAGVATVTAKTTTGQTATVKVKLRPILGALQLRSDLPEITGFGGGQTQIKIRRVDPAGAPLAEEKTLEVSVAVEGPGTVTPATVTIAGGASEATVVLKSTSFGTARITATAANKSSAPLEVMVRSVLGSLKLTAEQAAIADFGAGQTELRIQRFDPTGAPLAGESALPVTFAITGAGKLTPATVSIPAAESNARVTLISTGAGTVSITATAAGITSEPRDVSLTKTTHRLQLVPERTVALGMGLGRAKISITRQDAAGKDFPDPNPLAVPMQVTAPGYLENPSAMLKAGEISTSVVVFAHGTPTVSLKAGGVGGNNAEIEFVWPWAIVLAAAVGSAGGVAAQRFKVKGGTKRPVKKRATGAAAVGLVVVAIALLGSKLGVIPQGIVATIGGAFAFGAVLAFLGTFLIVRSVEPEAAPAEPVG